LQGMGVVLDSSLHDCFGNGGGRHRQYVIACTSNISSV
jgi:hypothetical protein